MKSGVCRFLLCYSAGFLNIQVSSQSNRWRGKWRDDEGLTDSSTTITTSNEKKHEKLRSGTSNDNYFIGTQAIYGPKWKSYRISPFEGHEYSEPDFDMLTEFRQSVALAGMNQFKFKLSPNACESYHLSCNSNEITSLTELSSVPEIAETFDDPRLKWYHIWTYSFNLPQKFRSEFTKEVMEAEYQETYEWAAHMLRTYDNTDKVFFVGNWEGDWELMWSSGCKSESGFDFDCAPTEDIVDKYVKWASTRQWAIDDAKRDFPSEGVDIFYYIEFNLGEENYQDHPTASGQQRPTILNSVVPAVNPDFLSYSSYKNTNLYNSHNDVQNFAQREVDVAFWDLLDYAESRLLPKGTDFSVMGEATKRVFVGEFGPKNTKDPTTFASTAAHVFRAALEWGCPFILHWETYDNDSHTEPLVPRGTQDLDTFGPLRQLFKDWNEEARVYVAQNQPTPEELRAWAVQWFTGIE